MTLVKKITTMEELELVYPVMSELRANLSLDSFITQFGRQQEQGYQIVALINFGDVMSLAGFRVCENFAMGKFLYIDDLVTAARFRSQGCGQFLLSWLKQFAINEGCGQLHLDSHVTRHGAHRFYLQQRLDISAYHFYVGLDGN